MDEKHFEHAAMLEQQQRDLEIARAREALEHRARPNDFDGSCPRCAAEIPVARVALGYYVCVDCMSAQERQAHLYSKQP